MGRASVTSAGLMFLNVNGDVLAEIGGGGGNTRSGGKGRGQ